MQFLLAGATSSSTPKPFVTVAVRSSDTGQLLTGVAYTAITAAKAQRIGAAVTRAITLTAGTIGTYTADSWIETQTPGIYQYCPTTADLASGATRCDWTFTGITGGLDATASAELIGQAGSTPDHATAAAIKVNTDNLPSAIKKNTPRPIPFYMVSSTDHVTPATGLTITAKRSLDGAAFATCAGTVTEVSLGWYYLSAAAGDLNGDSVAFHLTATGADPRAITVLTEP